ncbi:hypothetical protein GCM10018793_23950 [Streptomyces sulfonofaciens]|uniref:Uncharacterized protein n=1 Tax=Streptomyces sulfonofaciens TaxID=68272 RepID=A0A919G2G5_9ACTN|nr:hypothetical protein GCM10018793_23950 [Streptomyces sulfonofaciens]
MYGIAAGPKPVESLPNWLPGYERSAPVRVGDGTADRPRPGARGHIPDLRPVVAVLPRPPVRQNFVRYRPARSEAPMGVV